MSGCVLRARCGTTNKFTHKNQSLGIQKFAVCHRLLNSARLSPSYLPYPIHISSAVYVANEIPNAAYVGERNTECGVCGELWRTKYTFQRRSSSRQNQRSTTQQPTVCISRAVQRIMSRVLSRLHGHKHQTHGGSASAFYAITVRRLLLTRTQISFNYACTWT